jgi:hypothetical protein
VSDSSEALMFLKQTSFLIGDTNRKESAPFLVIFSASLDPIVAN